MGDEKRPYEAPQVLRLSHTSEAFGAHCESGSTPEDDCAVGNTAGAECSSGNSAVTSCFAPGATDLTNCNWGSSFD